MHKTDSNDKRLFVIYHKDDSTLTIHDLISKEYNQNPSIKQIRWVFSFKDDYCFFGNAYNHFVIFNEEEI